MPGLLLILVSKLVFFYKGYRMKELCRQRHGRKNIFEKYRVSEVKTVTQISLLPVMAHLIFMEQFK